jgi:predicted nucleic acid-binding protein
MAAFVDTNILLYAFSNASNGDPAKVVVANELVERLIRSEAIVLSAQVLNEFISVAMKKGKPPLTLDEVARIVGRLSRYTVLPIDASLVQLALQRVQQGRISYWDALIVEAAIRSGATILYTEDMHHGTRYGGLELRNPFLE